MKQIINYFTRAVCLTVITFIFAACGKPSGDSADHQTESTGKLGAFFAQEKPAKAISVAQARQSAKPGETVTLVGQIGGATSPFAEGFAAFVLADESLVFCSDNPEDDCGTPWDACCETPEKIKASRTMVQFLDDEGTPVPEGFKGVKGLAELDYVIVSGIVNANSNPDNLIINASSLYKLESDL